MRTHSSFLRRGMLAAGALLAIGVAGCGSAPEPIDYLPAPGDADAAGDSDAAAAQNAGVTADPAVAVVHRSPTCDCCSAHEAHLAEFGFATVDEVHDEDLVAWKEARGVPRELWSCHTTEVGGYLVEGHVPAETIARLLDEQPDIGGIALPGMPPGSPGMGGAQEEPWIIEAFVDGAPAGVFETR